MNKTRVGRYAAILRKSKHIQHDFDSFEQAKSWMESTGNPGDIAFIVATVRVRTAVSIEKPETADKVIDFANRTFGIKKEEI